MGEHGICGLPGGRLPTGFKVVFWGESFVEAPQVGDTPRMAKKSSALVATAGLSLAGVGRGNGGDARLHVFGLARMHDLRLGIFRLGWAIERGITFLILLRGLVPQAARGLHGHRAGLAARWEARGLSPGTGQGGNVVPNSVCVDHQL